MNNKTNFQFRFLTSTFISALGLLSTPAMADCTADSTGVTVTCANAATGYTYTNNANGVSLTVASGVTVDGSIALGGNSSTATNAGTIANTAQSAALSFGNTGTLNNSGTISGTSATVVTFGTNGTVTNTGTITSTTGITAIQLGANGTVNNSGTITSAVGTPAISFTAAGGSVTETSAATGGINGDIAFGTPAVAAVAAVPATSTTAATAATPGSAAVGSTGTTTYTLTNGSTAYGIQGNVIAVGNTNVDNNGLYTGNFTQSTASGADNVTFLNDTAAIFTGTITSADTTSVTNNGTATLSGSNILASAGAGISSFTNTGILNIGTSTAAAQITVTNGSFTQSAAGTTNLFVRAVTGTTTPVAGTTYSQIYAQGANGTASLSGTINVTPISGFYIAGTKYNVLLADQGITTNGLTFNGGTLPFVSFTPSIITTSGTQQAYQLTVVRTAYAVGIQSVANANLVNQTSVATGFDKLLASNASGTTGDPAALLGGVDVLTVAQAQTLFDQISPQGYGAYINAIQDQGNIFTRRIQARINGLSTDELERGFWLGGYGQGDIGGKSGYETKDNLIGLAGGYDVSKPNYIFGVALGYSNATLKYAPGSLNGHNNAYQLGAYAGYHFGRLSVDGQVSYSLGSLSATKTLNSGTLVRTANASANDHLFKAVGTIGIDLGTSDYTFKPFGGIDAASAKINSFTETGASSADLTVNGISGNRTDVLAGVDIIKKTGGIRPYLRGVYRYGLSGYNPNAISAYLNGDTTTTFSVTPTSSSRSEADIDAGINFVFDDNGVIFLGYQGTIRNDLSSHGINAGVRLPF